MIIADTSGLLALYNRSEPGHSAVAAVIDSADTPMVVSPFVIAELDYLVSTRMGVRSELAVLRELGAGAYILPEMNSADLLAAAVVIERYSDQEIGLADASLVVLGDRFGTNRLLTLDRRHFEVLRPLAGGRFELLPS